MKSLATFIAAASLARLASAHGYVDNATIGGTFYQVSFYFFYTRGYKHFSSTCIWNRQLTLSKFYQV